MRPRVTTWARCRRKRPSCPARMPPCCRPSPRRSRYRSSSWPQRRCLPLDIRSPVSLFRGRQHKNTCRHLKPNRLVARNGSVLPLPKHPPMHRSPGKLLPPARPFQRCGAGNPREQQRQRQPPPLRPSGSSPWSLPHRRLRRRRLTRPRARPRGGRRRNPPSGRAGSRSTRNRARNRRLRPHLSRCRSPRLGPYRHPRRKRLSSLSPKLNRRLNRNPSRQSRPRRKQLLSPSHNDGRNRCRATMRRL